METAELAPVVSNIAEVAPIVAAQAEEQSAAIDSERDAETAVLEAVIAAARPALKAISYRIKVGNRMWWPNNVQAAEADEYHSVRGIRIAGSGPSRDFPQSDSGEYEGTALYLMSDGTLAQLTYTGTWSRWQGASQEWTASIRPVTPRQAMNRWDLGDCVESLRAALQKQLDGGAKKQTQAAKERAERLTAIAQLIKK